MVTRFFVMPNIDRERAANQKRLQRKKQQHELALPPGNQCIVLSPDVQAQVAVMKQMIVDTNLQVTSVSINASLERQPVRRRLQKYRRLTMRGRVRAP